MLPKGLVPSRLPKGRRPIVPKEPSSPRKAAPVPKDPSSPRKAGPVPRDPSSPRKGRVPKGLSSLNKGHAPKGLSSPHKGHSNPVSQPEQLLRKVSQWCKKVLKDL